MNEARTIHSTFYSLQRPYAECCKNYFKRENLMRMFVINLLITILISMVFIMTNPKEWLLQIGISFIYTFSIGSSIFILIGFLDYFTARYSTFIKVLAYTIQFIIGGVLGTVLGTLFNSWILGFRVPADNYKYLFTFNIVMALVFGTAATAYFLIRGRLEQAITELKEKEIQEQKLNQLRTQAQLEALQSQINPHFLFNTLNSISSLIAEDPKVAESMIEKLSGLFRYALQASQKKMVSLYEELEIVRSYLEIEKVRLGERLQFHLRTEGDNHRVFLPGLCLQPLVENSIKHGISPKVGGGIIQIDTKVETEYCRIVLKDNGVGLRSKETDSGHGLLNIQQRLQLTYGGRSRFTITENSGVTVEILIPLEIK